MDGQATPAAPGARVGALRCICNGFFDEFFNVVINHATHELQTIGGLGVSVSGRMAEEAFELVCDLVVLSLKFFVLFSAYKRKFHHRGPHSLPVLPMPPRSGLPSVSTISNVTEG